MRKPSCRKCAAKKPFGFFVAKQSGKTVMCVAYHEKSISMAIHIKNFPDDKESLNFRPGRQIVAIEGITPVNLLKKARLVAAMDWCSTVVLHRFLFDHAA